MVLREHTNFSIIVKLNSVFPFEDNFTISHESLADSFIRGFYLSNLISLDYDAGVFFT